MEFPMLENNEDLIDAIDFIDAVLLRLPNIEINECFKWISDLHIARMSILQVIKHPKFKELVEEAELEYDKLEGLFDARSL